MDRQVLGVLKTTLQHDLGWDEISYSNLVFAFQAAYAVGMLVMGPVLDRLGTRWGYSLSMIFWSAASMAHAACNSIFSFTMARSALGLGESEFFSCKHKNGCRVVSAKGARSCYWHLQCRLERRCDLDAAHHSLDHNSLRVADGVPVHRSFGLHMARFLGCLVSQAGRAPALVAARIRLHHPQRIPPIPKIALDQTPSTPRNLGILR
jgi:hypothetical protein